MVTLADLTPAEGREERDDVLLSGGSVFVDADTVLNEDAPDSPTQWQVEWTNDATPDQIGIANLCANR